jgi:hypothetical protein
MGFCQRKCLATNATVAHSIPWQLWITLLPYQKDLISLKSFDTVQIVDTANLSVLPCKEHKSIRPYMYSSELIDSCIQHHIYSVMCTQERLPEDNNDGSISNLLSTR